MSWHEAFSDVKYELLYSVHSCRHLSGALILKGAAAYCLQFAVRIWRESDVQALIKEMFDSGILIDPTYAAQFMQKHQWEKHNSELNDRPHLFTTIDQQGSIRNI